MHFSIPTAVTFVATFSLTQLAAAHPAKHVHATTVTADLPRVTLTHDVDKAGKPKTVPQVVTVHTKVSVYEKRALKVKSFNECSDLCEFAGNPRVPHAVKNCMGATYNKRTELCVLTVNAKKLDGGIMTMPECPLGYLVGEKYPTVEVQEWRPDDVEEKDYCKKHDCDEQSTWWGRCYFVDIM